MWLVKPVASLRVCGALGVSEFGMPLHEAIPTSLIMAAAASAAAVLPRLRGGVRWGTALIVAAAGTPAALLGSYINTLLDPDLVLNLFGGVMVLAGVQLLRPRPVGSDQVPSHTLSSVAVSIVTGLLVGFLTGLLGVGGGFVIVPALILLVKLPAPLAVGTSLVVICANSIAGLAAHAGSTQLNWPVTIAFTGAAIVASFGTGLLGRRLPAKLIQRVFAGMVFLIATITVVATIVT